MSSSSGSVGDTSTGPAAAHHDTQRSAAAAHDNTTNSQDTKPEPSQKGETPHILASSSIMPTSGTLRHIIYSPYIKTSHLVQPLVVADKIIASMTLFSLYMVLLRFALLWPTLTRP